MRFELLGDQGRIQVLVGRRRVAGAVAALNRLRDQTGQAADHQTAPEWFLTRTLMWGSYPVVVLFMRGDIVVAAALLHGRRIAGVPIGVLKSGDLSGEGGVVAPAWQRVQVMESAVKACLQAGLAHTILASVRQVVPSLPLGQVYRWSLDPERTEGIDGVWQSRDVRTHLALEGSADGLTGDMGRKLRRNIRYYRKRSEQELGCRFLPMLSADQSIDAVRALHGCAPHPVPSRRAGRHEAALRCTPNGFAMGLIDRNGTWLSYLAGWRQADATYVEWQLNCADYPALSLTTVMRGYFLAHEAARGVPAVVFVGGTSAAWGRACRRELCDDLLAVRTGPMSTLLHAATAWVRPNGRIARLLRDCQVGQAAWTSRFLV